MCSSEFLDLCEGCDCADCALSGGTHLDALAEEIDREEAEA